MKKILIFTLILFSIISCENATLENSIGNSVNHKFNASHQGSMLNMGYLYTRKY